MAIKLYGSPLHDDIGIETRDPIMLGDQGWYIVVKIVRRVFTAPSIISPVDNGLVICFAINQEGRTVIAAPGVVGGVEKK